MTTFQRFLHDDRSTGHIVTGLFLYLVVCVSLIITAACHAPVTITTDAGKAAYQADDVVLRLQEFSNLVKADTGTAPGNISYKDGFTIIEWVSGDANGTPPTTGIVQIVQTTAGQGWKAAARLTWESRIKPLVSKYPAIAAWVDILDSLLAVIPAPAPPLSLHHLSATGPLLIVEAR